MPVSVYSAWAKRRPYFDAVTGATFYGPRPPLALDPAEDDTFHTWRDGDRLGAVATAAWGEPRLWWVICDVNDLVDPFAVPVGTVLRLPSRARVELAVLG